MPYVAAAAAIYLQNNTGEHHSRQYTKADQTKYTELHIASVLDSALVVCLQAAYLSKHDAAKATTAVANMNMSNDTQHAYYIASFAGHCQQKHCSVALMVADLTFHCMDMSNHKALNMLLSLRLMRALI